MARTWILRSNVSASVCFETILLHMNSVLLNSLQVRSLQSENSALTYCYHLRLPANNSVVSSLSMVPSSTSWATDAKEFSSNRWTSEYDELSWLRDCLQEIGTWNEDGAGLITPAGMELLQPWDVHLNNWLSNACGLPVKEIISTWSGNLLFFN